VGEILTRTVGITHRHRIRVPVDIVLLGKAWLTLEGTVRRLDPSCNLVELAQPYHRRILRERYGPKAIAGGLRRMSGDYLMLARTLPGQVRRLVGSLARGAFRMDLKHEHLDDLIREIDRSANRLSFSLIIGATIIGSSLIMVTDRGVKLFGYPLLGVVGYLIAGLFGLWLVIAILRSGRL
jgi:ubiquinone biosynthesis protein